MSWVLVFTTVSSQEQATTLADALITEGLAACVQTDTVISQYVWQGLPESTQEIRLSIKTDRRLMSRIEALFAQQHPYDCPQIIAVPAEFGTEYAAWAAAALTTE